MFFLSMFQFGVKDFSLFILPSPPGGHLRYNQKALDVSHSKEGSLVEAEEQK